MDGRYLCSSSTLGIWFGVVEVGYMVLLFLAFENCHTHFPSDCTCWHIPVIYKGSFFLHPCRKHFFSFVWYSGVCIQMLCRLWCSMVVSFHLVEAGSLVLLFFCVFQGDQQASRQFFCFRLPSCCINARLQIWAPSGFWCVMGIKLRPSGLHNKSFFLQSHLSTGSFALGTIALLTRGNWNTKVVLSCISMVANGVEFFLQCLLAICVSSFEAPVFTFITHFLIVLFIFLMYSFSMSLDIDLLWDICGRQPTLPQFCRLPLNLKCSCICCKEAF